MAHKEEFMHSRRSAARNFVALLLLAATLSAGAAEVLTLPRKFGPLSLAMQAKEFKRATGVNPAGQCADCVANQNVVELGNQFFSRTLDWFPSLARRELSEETTPTVFFFKDRLEFILFSFGRYDYAGIKAALIRVLGEDYQREEFPSRCLYAGGLTLTWSDVATIVTLTEYSEEGGKQLDLKLADRKLTEEAEKLQEIAQSDAIKELEQLEDCNNPQAKTPNPSEEKP
jgi:hypothetical protein